MGIVVHTEVSDLDIATGRISLAGCKKCQEKVAHIYECQHFNDEENNPCYTSHCIDNKMLFAACEKTPTGETDDCVM
ncbi:MAG: hypothetical protein M3552_19165, partial [Planctomycetota bacterium]|nr:hypothetical protein [Planctomycetota bacterium]